MYDTLCRNMGVEFADAVTREIIRQAVGRQAAGLTEESFNCGVCDRPPQEPDLEPHAVNTRRGEAGAGRNRQATLRTFIVDVRVGSLASAFSSEGSSS